MNRKQKQKWKDGKTRYDTERERKMKIRGLIFDMFIIGYGVIGLLFLLSGNFAPGAVMMIISCGLTTLRETTKIEDDNKRRNTRNK